MSKSGSVFFIIGGVVATVIGIGLSVYGAVKHYNRNEKTTTHTILMIAGIILILAGIILFIVGLVKSGKNKKEKLAEIGIELTPTAVTDNAPPMMEKPVQPMFSPPYQPMYQAQQQPMYQPPQSMYQPQQQSMYQPPQSTYQPMYS